MNWREVIRRFKEWLRGLWHCGYRLPREDER